MFVDVVVARKRRELDLGINFLRFCLGAVGDLNEEGVSEVTDAYGRRFKFFVGGVQRRNEGGSYKKAKGGVKKIIDFHVTIFMLFEIY